MVISSSLICGSKIFFMSRWMLKMQDNLMFIRVRGSFDKFKSGGLLSHWKKVTWIIRGDSRLVDITGGGDFLGLCDQKINTKFVRFWTVTELWAFFNSRTRPRVNRVSRNQLAGDVLSVVAYLLRCQRYFRQLTRAVQNWVSASVAAGGGIFENQL